MKSVHLTIESILTASERPSRLIVWLSEGDLATAPRSLTRMRRRGVEIRTSKNYGPHTKYFPYVRAMSSHSGPLVTADDDLIYPYNWLRDLRRAHELSPDTIHCYRGRRMLRKDATRLAPYESWPLASSSDGMNNLFLTGVCGVIYPWTFLLELQREGEAFADRAPRADDVWLNFVAYKTGYQIALVGPGSAVFPEVRESQVDALKHSNVAGHANDAQIEKTFDGTLVEALAAPVLAPRAS